MNKKQMNLINSSEFTDDTIDIQVVTKQWQIIQHYGSWISVYYVVCEL